MAVVMIPVGGYAGPMVLEETAKLSAPDASYTQFGQSVAVDGSSAVVVGRRLFPESGDDEDAAFLFERQSNGTWSYVRPLVQQIQNVGDFSTNMTVDLSAGLGAIVDKKIWVLERTSGWTPQQIAVDPDTTGDVEVDSGTVLVSEGACNWAARAFRRDVNGVWQPGSYYVGEHRGCDDDWEGGDVDISGSSVILASSFADDLDNPPGTRIFQGLTSTPTVAATLGLSEVVAIDGTSAVSNTSAFRLAGGAWSQSGSVRPADFYRVARASSVELKGGLAVVGFPNDPLRGNAAGSVSVFQRNSSGAFTQVAKLVASDAQANAGLGRRVEISGRRVIAGASQAAYVFDLPTSLTQRATVQDDFQDGNAATWTPLAGSTFNVVSTATSWVYRQTNVAGNAASFLSNMDWTNQAIQADAKPTAFATTSGEKWLGLAVRYTDANNMYYVTVRNTNVVQLRKLVNGAITILASASLPVTLNANYRLRVEAIGTRIRAYVDNSVVLEATDKSLTHGQAGVFMYRTQADYDNIVVSANPRTVLFSDTFEQENANWTLVGNGIWSRTGPAGSIVYAQSSTGGDARAVTGINTDDQIIQTRVKPTAFASGGEQWFGIAARYVDDQNYYYLTLRNNNTISLRKVVNGGITVLDSASLAVNLNTWYRLRLEAVGNLLRVYVNDQLLLETSDTSFASGKYAALMYRATAQYDNFSVYQP